MKANETALSLIKLAKYAILLLIAIGVGLFLWFNITFHKPIVIEPTINIENLINIDDDIFVDDYFVIEIDGSEYEEYCEFDYKKMIKRGFSFGEPVAYTYHRGPHYYSYYVPIIGLPEGEWFASFREDGSAGKISKKNCEFIWKKVGADDVLNAIG